MRSLFLKIFFWFWISVVLISLTMVLITAIAQSNSENAAWQNQAIFASESVRAVDIYEREGAPALKKHFEHLPKRPLHAYLFDEHGTEVLGQKLPEQAIQLSHKKFPPPHLLGPGMKIDGTPLASAPIPPGGAPGYPVRIVHVPAPPNFDQDTSSTRVIATQVTGSSGSVYTFLVVVPPFSVKAFLTS